MSKKYKLEDFRVLSGNSFSKKDVDLLYFSIDKIDGFPKDIKEATDSMLSHIINEYEMKQGNKLDINGLDVDARLLISLAKQEHKPEHTIDVTISSHDSDSGEILLYDELVVRPGTKMFEIFKRCFMNQLEEALFGEWAS